MTDYVEPIDHTALARVRDSVESFLREGLAQPCETEEQRSWWAVMLDAAHSEWSKLELERKNLTAPIVAAQKSVNQAFRLPMCSLECMKDMCKAKLSAFALAVEERRASAVAALTEAAASGESEAIVQAVAALPEDQGGSWQWVPEVSDASAVPDAYKIVDVKMLRAYAKTFARLDTIPSVPGVRFTREKVIKAKCS